MVRHLRSTFLVGLLVLGSALSTGASGLERIFFRPPVASVAVGDTLSVYVTIDSGISLVHYFRVKMQFDTTVLRLDTIVPSRAWDSIAAANAGHTFYYQDSLDPGVGEFFYDVFSALFTQPPHIDGYNDLVRIRFTALASGISPVSFFSYRLENNVGLGQVIPCSASDGLVYVCPLPSGFQPGDANGDGGINVGDLTYLVNYLFRGGAEPTPVYLNGDANCDLFVNVGDLTYLVNYLFRGGLPPCDPCE